MSCLFEVREDLKELQDHMESSYGLLLSESQLDDIAFYATKSDNDAEPVFTAMGMSEPVFPSVGGDENE